jgi:tRNA(Ile)-lysidine synthase
MKQLNLSPDTHFLLGVSGGIDSVVLCSLSSEAGLKFSIGHCNFGLRGAESNWDETFVRRLGSKYKTEVYVKNFNTETIARENKRSIQETARDLRYEWFREMKSVHGFAYVLLGHHSNDNIETVLMHFFRGTGLKGLTGIQPVSPDGCCFRPMLSFTRNQVADYAGEKGLEWVEDASNASDKYTRNFFRNWLIPEIGKVYPKAEENLLANIERFNKTEVLYKQLVDGLKKKLLQQQEAEVRIPVLQLMQYQHTSMIYEVIKDFHFDEAQVEEVIKLASSGSGKYIENETFRIIRHGRWFVIASKTAEASAHTIEKEEGTVSFESGSISIDLPRISKFSIDPSAHVAQLDSKHIEFPLLLRKWKQGDYFYPLGMRKKKKLSRFLIDQKMPKHQKENVWVIEANKKIIWVVGHRIDDRFKVTPSTKDIIRFRFLANAPEKMHRSAPRNK